MGHRMRTFPDLVAHHPRATRWIGGTLLTLLVLSALCVALLSISNWNFARGALAGFIGGKIDRPVRIDGSLRAQLLSSTPTVRIEKLAIGNPAWLKAEDFATADTLTIAIE